MTLTFDTRQQEDAFRLMVIDGAKAFVRMLAASAHANPAYMRPVDCDGPWTRA